MRGPASPSASCYWYCASHPPAPGMAPTREGPQCLLRSIDRSIASTVLVSAFSMGRPILPHEVLRISICLLVANTRSLLWGNPKFRPPERVGRFFPPLNISECNLRIADRNPRDFHPRLSKKEATERNHARSKGIRTRIDSQFHPLRFGTVTSWNERTHDKDAKTDRAVRAGWLVGGKSPCAETQRVFIANPHITGRCLRLCPLWVLNQVVAGGARIERLQL